MNSVSDRRNPRVLNACSKINKYAMTIVVCFGGMSSATSTLADAGFQRSYLGVNLTSDDVTGACWGISAAASDANLPYIEGGAVGQPQKFVVLTSRFIVNHDKDGTPTECIRHNDIYRFDSVLSFQQAKISDKDFINQKTLIENQGHFAGLDVDKLQTDGEASDRCRLPIYWKEFESQEFAILVISKTPVTLFANPLFDDDPSCAGRPTVKSSILFSPDIHYADVGGGHLFVTLYELGIGLMFSANLSFECIAPHEGDQALFQKFIMIKKSALTDELRKKMFANEGVPNSQLSRWDPANLLARNEESARNLSLIAQSRGCHE